MVQKFVAITIAPKIKPMTNPPAARMAAAFSTMK
jgi:hypothetical protein